MIKIQFLVLFFSFLVYVNAQETEGFKPYTIESTYQKLISDYPFITPIYEVDSILIQHTENVVYKEINNTFLHMDIYSPIQTAEELRPAVILIHGGGWLTGSKENQRIMAQHLALNGYVAIAVEYRLGLVAPYPAGIIDVKDALVFIRRSAEKYHIDSNKIAILGASSGAQMASLIGLTAGLEIYEPDSLISDGVQAIINIDGIVSFVHPEAAAEGRMASIWLNGNRTENPHNWKEASPLEYIHAEAPPILFINSSKDRFHAGRNDLMAQYYMFDIYYELHTIAKSPHSFWLVNPWFDETLQYVLEFLDLVFEY